MHPRCTANTQAQRAVPNASEVPPRLPSVAARTIHEAREGGFRAGALASHGGRGGHGQRMRVAVERGRHGRHSAVRDGGLQRRWQALQVRLFRAAVLGFRCPRLRLVGHLCVVRLHGRRPLRAPGPGESASGRTATQGGLGRPGPGHVTRAAAHKCPPPLQPRVCLLPLGLWRPPSGLGGSGRWRGVQVCWRQRGSLPRSPSCARRLAARA
eukprot:scaffold417_cov252-Pinguiococcus_pyrenoidosus.AAC.15